MTVTMGLCVGYLHTIIEGIKSYKPEVKASKSDKRLRVMAIQSFACFHINNERCSHLLNAEQTPTVEKFDIPAYRTNYSDHLPS